jgi:hypothetical protein
MEMKKFGKYSFHRAQEARELQVGNSFCIKTIPPLSSLPCSMSGKSDARLWVNIMLD